jgi:cobalt-precorrin-5B (C1)-methyltransferase
LEANLRDLVAPGRCLQLEVVFPLGRELAQRTSNAAFGVVDGLALIGTQAEVQSSASPDQLRASLDALQAIAGAADFCGSLTLVIGENGLDLAHQLGLADQQPLLKAGNWIGPLLVASAEAGVSNLLLLGYHGKLVKLAGGIFHTHHHLADGRLEVLAAIALQQGLGVDLIKELLGCASMESALQELQKRDSPQADRVWQAIAQAVELRSEAYLKRYGTWPMRVGAALFDRQRQLRWAGVTGHSLLAHCGLGIHSEGGEARFDPSLR